MEWHDLILVDAAASGCYEESLRRFLPSVIRAPHNPRSSHRGFLFVDSVGVDEGFPDCILSTKICHTRKIPANFRNARLTQHDPACTIYTQ